MKELDNIEVIVEKKKYAKEGIHKGMHGWICYDTCVDGCWLVNFPQYGEKDDIATISIHEDDMKAICKNCGKEYIKFDKVIYFDPYKIETDRHDADIIFITHNISISISSYRTLTHWQGFIIKK